MKALTLNKSTWLLVAIFALLVCLAYPQISLAEDTKVECTAPMVVVWATGGGVTPRPQVTIFCTGGSSVPGIVGFAYPLAPPPNFNFNANFANSIPTVVGLFVREFGSGATITLYSDLSITSGNNWGCGASNCRILDQVIGY